MAELPAVYCDTSALVALLDEDDPRCAAARTWWAAAFGRRLVTSELAVTECSAVVARRLGTTAARVLHHEVLAPVELHFVDELGWMRATSAWLAAPGGASLVDRTAFELMRQLGIDHAFAYDRHFEQEGFTLVAQE